jgi:hypothetical protein
MQHTPHPGRQPRSQGTPLQGGTVRTTAAAAAVCLCCCGWMIAPAKGQHVPRCVCTSARIRHSRKRLTYGTAHRTKRNSNSSSSSSIGSLCWLEHVPYSTCTRRHTQHRGRQPRSQGTPLRSITVQTLGVFAPPSVGVDTLVHHCCVLRVVYLAHAASSTPPPSAPSCAHLHVTQCCLCASNISQNQIGCPLRFSIQTPCSTQRHNPFPCPPPRPSQGLPRPWAFQPNTPRFLLHPPARPPMLPLCSSSSCAC